MTAFAIFMMLLTIYLTIRLWLSQQQMTDLAQQLKERPPKSNQRLTVFLRDRSVVELCNEINRCIDAGQNAVLQSEEAQRQLKYTISCVSHDIRTPLAGADRYMQLLEKTSDPAKQLNYCRIIRQKLKDLEHLLDELFLYTQLTGGTLQLSCSQVQLFPVVCDTLAGFYEAFVKQGFEPCVSFSDEAVRVFADAGQLRRVLGNLISNALSYGDGAPVIRQEKNRLSVSNKVKDPQSIRPGQMFERFYRDDTSRRGPHAGLGLSIARELIEQMGGNIRAQLTGDMLEITIEFSRAEAHS